MPKWIKYLSSLYHKCLLAVSSRQRLKGQLLSREERVLLSLKKDSFLEETGWIRSKIEKDSIDAGGDALPWMTYSSIYFLRDRLNESMNVFEYGSGRSTQFFAKRVNRIISVEHDRDWAQKVRQNLPPNAELIEVELDIGGAYAKSIHETKEKFELVVIDGRDRVNCCREAVSELTENGVILLDNSDRERYEEGIQFLRSQRFRMLSFWGMAPMSPILTCTALFYRNNNCLEI